MLYDFGLGVMTSILIRPAKARDAKQRAYTRVYTRAIRGDYVVVPPHNNTHKDFANPYALSQKLELLLIQSI